MNNFYLLILCSLLSFSNISAQWKLGPVTSYGISTAKSESTLLKLAPGMKYNLSFKSKTPSLSMGLSAWKRIGHSSFLQVECQYVQDESSFEFAEISNRSIEERSQQDGIYREYTKSIQWMVSSGFYYKKWRFGLGPIIESVIEHESDFSNFDSYLDVSRMFNTSIQTSISYQYTIFDISLKYVFANYSVDNHFMLTHDIERRLTRSPNEIKMSFGILF